MATRKKLSIGNDEFCEMRELDYYYVDKSLMIKDFIEMGDKVALIARPRRFGKTINMTMVREFFDITVDSRQLFKGLAIMETPYAAQMNTCPVIFLTFKNCKGASSAELIFTMKEEILREYLRYERVVSKTLEHSFYDRENYYSTLNVLKDKDSSYIYLTTCLANLTRIVAACYSKKPLLLIDEYDQPIMSSHEYGYHDELGAFFSTFFGSALKGNQSLKQALVKASASFWQDFDILASGKETTVWLNLDTSYVERESNYSLWGLMVNAGYLTVLHRNNADSAVVRIPNNEVMNEFLKLVTEISGLEGQGLADMFSSLLKGDINRFITLYQEAVISCTSYMDAKENAYHMLMLGMCMTLRGSYEVTSNPESGLGRSDITLRAPASDKPNVIIEFKQGTDLEALAEQALKQIEEQQYYHSLKGKTLCIGLAHDKKRCRTAYRMFEH